MEKMQWISERSARFVSALVAVRSADDPEPLVAMGRWHGQLLNAAQGEHGFGYDPLLFIPAFNCSVAELNVDLKNQYSHRAIAAANMLAQMREVWRLG